MKLTPHEQFCLDTADHFTVVRGRTPKQRTRERASSLDEAKALAAKHGDGRSMIYAVNAAGNNAHICNA